MGDLAMAVKHVVAALAVAAAVAPAALADAFKITVDQTVALKVPGAANSVIVGNASVADVAVHDASTLLVTGKSFGTTNLMVLDRAGRTIYANQVQVGGQADSDMTIVRAGGTYTYSCIEKCRSTATVGDVSEYFQETMQTLQAKSGAAKGD
jgi:Flp pilus assembly secretin CpaC